MDIPDAAAANTPPASKGPVATALLFVLGVLLLLVSAATVVVAIATLFFTGMDWTEEIGHTGEGAAFGVTALATIGVMIGIAGWVLVSPVVSRVRHGAAGAAGATGGRHPLRRSSIVLLLLAVALPIAATAGLATNVPPLTIGAGLAQIAVAVVAFVRARSAARGRRWPYITLAIVSLVANPITVVAVAAAVLLASGYAGA